MKRGKKGEPGEKRWFRCPKCNKVTLHEFQEIKSSPPTPYWVCTKCKNKRPARYKKDSK